jgi:DNA-binding transcriptional MerR regulator
MDKNKQILSEAINDMVRKVLAEKMNKQAYFDTLVESTVSEKLKKLYENDDNSNKKRSVIQWLQDPGVNTAEIRRQLEGEPQSQEEEDSKRSYFMKKVNQTHGKDFTDEEINHLYALKSGLGY